MIEGKVIAVAVTAAKHPRWSQGEFQQVLLARSCAEVIRGPEITSRNRVPFNQAIIGTDTGNLEGSTLGDIFANIRRNINAQIAFQLLRGTRQIQYLVVKRWPRTKERKPVSAHIGNVGFCGMGQGIILAVKRPHPIGIV